MRTQGLGNKEDWCGIDNPPEKLHEIYRVRLVGGAETWALYAKTADWRGWNGESFGESLNPIAWRYPRPSELSGSTNKALSSHSPWKEADDPPSLSRSVWVVWSDWTEGLARYLPEMGGWWKVDNNGPMEKSKVTVVRWREYWGDDSGLLVLSRELREWISDNRPGFLIMADLLNRGDQ